MQVLRGGDRAIDMVVIDPSPNVVQYESAKTEGYITHKATTEGKGRKQEDGIYLNIGVVANYDGMVLP